jgi:hypothetical protein
MRRIGGVVRADVDVYEHFETIDMLDLWFQQPSAMRHAACVLRTLYETLHQLHGQYNALVNAQPPLPRSLRDNALDREVPLALHDPARYSFSPMYLSRRRLSCFIDAQRAGTQSNNVS